jgi:hypothetical protein
VAVAVKRGLMRSMGLLSRKIVVCP